MKVSNLARVPSKKTDVENFFGLAEASRSPGRGRGGVSTKELKISADAVDQVLRNEAVGVDLEFGKKDKSRALLGQGDQLGSHF